MQDTVSTYQIRIQLFTQSTAVNADKVYIKSTTEVHEYEVTKDNFNIHSI